MGLEGFEQWNEGRSSETCRRLTFRMLFSREGKPQAWLFVLLGLWGLVAAVAFGSP